MGRLPKPYKVVAGTHAGQWRTTLTLIDRRGARRRIEVFGRSANECRQKTNALRLEHLRRGSKLPEEVTLGAALSAWLNSLRASSLSRKTVSYYECQAPHIAALLGKRSHLSAIGLQDIERMMVSHAAAVSPATGRRYSARSVHHLRKAASSFFTYAVRSGWAERNPCQWAKAPVANVSRPGSAWTADDAARFLAEIRGHHLEPLLTLALTLGLRQGELIGLTWDRCSNRQLIVDRQLLYLSGCFEFTSTKETDRRRLPVSDGIAELLAAHRLRQVEELRKLGAANTLNLVFLSEVGRPIIARDLRRAFYRLRDKAELPKITFHGLRHTCATLLNALGVDAATRMAILGHRTAAVTEGIYTHPTTGGMESAVALIGEALRISGQISGQDAGQEEK